MKNTTKLFAALLMISSLAMTARGQQPGAAPGKGEGGQASTGNGTSVLPPVKEGLVSGIVSDDKGKPVESATITLLSARDSSQLKMTITDKAGFFRFEHISGGKYLVSVSSVGHDKAYSAAFELSSGHTSMTLN